MLILDTNHYSELGRRGAIGLRLEQRLDAAGEDAFLTIVTAAEALRGWLSAIRPNAQADRGVWAYAELQACINDLATWDVLPWSQDAADTFGALKKRLPNIGTLDLRIASIALEYDATVLTRNLKDFNRVPGLKFENWLD